MIHCPSLRVLARINKWLCRKQSVRIHVGFLTILSCFFYSVCAVATTGFVMNGHVKNLFFKKKKISSVFDYSSYAGNIVSLHAWKHQKHLLVPNSHNSTPVTSPNDLCLKFYLSCPTFPPAAASKCFC